MRSPIQYIFYSMLFLTEDKASTWAKAVIFMKLLATIAPIAYLLEITNVWFINNKQFITFIIAAIFINMIIGAWRHRKLSTFRWEGLLIKTVKMMAILFTTYILLEMIRVTVGNNILTDGFKVVIQVATIFYPASKALKSVYVISNGEYPPKWIMEKIYSFDKNGDLAELFNTKKETIDDL